MNGQADDYINWPILLWGITSQPWWNIVISLLAATTAVVSFAKMILRHPVDALLIARSIVNIGLLGVAYSILTSGALKIGLFFIVVGLAMSTFLLLTDWCHRANPWRDMVHFLARPLGRCVSWLCGPRRRSGPGDAVALSKDDEG